MILPTNFPRWILPLILLASFCYFFRLQETYPFVNDTARDTLHALRLWQTKEFTLLGPPVSFGQNTHRELFFGSGSLYLALLGLLVSGFSPKGATYPTIILTLFSIPILYLLLKRLSRTPLVPAIGTFLYAFSPVTVYFVRFFWNPNPLIPLSVFFWYLVTTRKTHKYFLLFMFVSGTLAGFMTNLHYFSLIPVLTYLGVLVFQKKYFPSIWLILGLFIGLSPLWVFELRNHFYLTGALLSNLQRGGEHSLFSFSLLTSSFAWVWDYLGFGLGQDHLRPLVSFPPLLLSSLFIFCLFFIAQKTRQYSLILIFSLSALVAAAASFVSVGVVHLRYFFALTPLIIWLLAEIICRVRFLIPGVILCLSLGSFRIVTEQLSISSGVIPLPLASQIATIIVKDNPEGSWNVSQTLTGDARALAFRYYLELEAPNKPQSEASFANLGTLYVISRDLPTVLLGERFEYREAKSMTLTRTLPLEGFSIYRFDEQSPLP